MKVFFFSLLVIKATRRSALLEPPFLLLLAVVLCLSVVVQASPDPRARGAWWIEQHGALTLEDEPRLPWVRAVWKRVEAASERSLKRLPRLLFLRSHRTPLALALADGSVILNHAVVRLVYDEQPRHVADARMAFLLGHELAHLAMDDFWQSEAFHGVRDDPLWSNARQRLEQLLGRRASDHGSREIQLRELQADSHGMITMNAAGYDPRLILEGDSGFFRLWSARVMELQKIPPSGDHPSDTERAALLRSQLNRVRNQLLVFEAGTKLLQLGRYEDARILLEEFRNRFPGRAVFNNLGLAEYQLALRQLASCDPLRVSRYLTSLVADVETRGSLTRGALSNASSGQKCLAKPAFRVPFRRALDYFTQSAAMDPDYHPARVNLSSARLMAGDAAGAMSAADEVLRRSPGHLQALNNKAVALHEFGLQMGMDTTDRALLMLKNVLRRRPGFLPANYNRAVLLSQRQRNAAAEEAWRELDRFSLPQVYRREVLRRTGRTAFQDAVSPDVGIPSPWPLGVLSPARLNQLERFGCVGIRSGEFRAKLCADDEHELLVIKDRVELVSARPGSALKKQLKRLGKPSRTLTVGGWKTKIYSGFMLESHRSGTRKVWWYVPAG